MACNPTSCLQGAAWLHDVLADTGTAMSDAARDGREHPDMRGRTVGVITQMSGERNAPEVVGRFEHACSTMSDLGADLVPVSLPRTGQALSTYFTLSSVEALMVLETHALCPGLGPEALYRLTRGRELLGTASWEDADAARGLIREDIAQALSRCDVLVSPTMPLVAPPIGRPGVDDPLAIPRTDWWTVEANLATMPAMSLPCGLGEDTGLPVGLQLVAPGDRDAELYRVGAALECAGLEPIRPPVA